MIPQEFQDYFQGSCKESQQMIINSLLGFMDASVSINSVSDFQAMHCPHCLSKKIRANGKLKQVQRILWIKPTKNAIIFMQ